MTPLYALAATYILAVLFTLLFVQGARRLEERSEELTAIEMERRREFVRALAAFLGKSFRKTADIGSEDLELADTITRNVASAGKNYIIFRTPPTWTDQ